MTDGVKHFGKRNRDEQETVADAIRDGAPMPEPRAERTRWQMMRTRESSGRRDAHDG